MPTNWKRPAYPRELTKTYWQSKRSIFKHGEGVGKLVTALEQAYSNVNWDSMELMDDPVILRWGQFTVSDWNTCFRTANSTLTGDCAKFSRLCYTTRDELNKIETKTGKTFKDTKKALKAMATAADQLGVASNKNSILGQLAKMHEEHLAEMQKMADGLLPMLKKALKKVPKVSLEMGLILKGIDDGPITEQDKINTLNNLLFKGARDLSQNTGNLKKVVEKGLASGTVNMQKINALNKAIAPWCNDSSFFKAGQSTKNDVKKVVKKYLTSAEAIDL